MKRVLHIILMLLLVAIVVIILGFIEKEQESVRICKIKIKIDNNNSEPFITDDDILLLIKKKYDSVIGRYMSEISLEELKQIIQNIPYSKRVDVFTAINGTLHVRIQQRQPSVRVINNNGEGCYIDADGYLMPLHPQKAARVIIANGNLTDPLNAVTSLKIDDKHNELGESDLSDLEKVYLLVNCINNDKFLKAQIEQIYFNGTKEIELVPKMGSHIIHFGEINDMEKKFWKLKIFYTKILEQEGWEKYKIINLKYANQIVCSK
ncbi:MAG: hypothetical protein KAG99_00280 [Bacteroidales bacterium]|nr:hypothetical protein [Bacteroidales bacterium]